MGNQELGANLFRITQTEGLIEKNNIKGEENACNTHYKVGAAVRKTIKELGETMPEELPTPEKSTKEIEEDIIKKLKS